jgi:hypothetical protein
MDIQKEKQNALLKYGNFNSTHELYGVLFEEVEEFFEVVRKNTPNSKGKREMMIRELNQIAAVAQRGAEELKDNKIKWV